MRGGEGRSSTGLVCLRVTSSLEDCDTTVRREMGGRGEGKDRFFFRLSDNDNGEEDGEKGRRGEGKDRSFLTNHIVLLD